VTINDTDLVVDVGVLRTRVDGLETRLAAQIADARLDREETRRFHESVRADVAALATRVSDYALANERSRTTTLLAALVAAAGGITTLVATFIGHVL
jgi:hypothetical protein